MRGEIMWDFDKLFAEGNVVGLLYPDGEIVLFPCKFREESNIENLIQYYGNKDLKCEDYKIQYIIRLDEHGNVVEKVFDRERDIKPEPDPMPELETGMFVRVADKTDWRDSTVAYVDHQNNRIIAKEGWYETLSRKDEWQYLRIVEVFSKNVCCFNQCKDSIVIWRSSEYQDYLDSKSN